MAGLLAIVVGLLLYGTLSPFHFNFSAGGHPIQHLLESWPNQLSRNVIRDALLNVAIFVPLGVTAYLTFAGLWSRGSAFAIAVLQGAGLSLAIEILQYYDAHRYSSLADLVCNTSGAILGASLALIFQDPIEKVTSAAERRGAPTGLMLGACWMAAQLYPLLPNLTFARLSAGWYFLIHSRLSWVEVIGGAAGWFVFALALRTVWTRFSWRWLSLAMLAVPLRLVILDRVVTVSDVAAAAVGLVLWALASDNVKVGAAWTLLLAGICLRELTPFRFSSAGQPFNWIPFAATMAAEHAPGIAVILRKAFEYGALIWLIHAGRVRYRVAGVLVAVALLALELAQTHIAGHVPEITDAVLALIMAAVLGFLT